MITQDQNKQVETKEAKKLTLLNEDVYVVEVLDVEVKEHETYDYKYAKTEEDKAKAQQFEDVFNIQFVVLEGEDSEGNDARGRSIWQNFVPSYFYDSYKNGKNLLFRIVEAAWRRELTEEEIADFDYLKMNKLIGKQVRVVTKNKQSGENTYTNIDSYLKAVQKPELSLTAEEKAAATPKKEDEPQTVETDLTADDIGFPPSNG